MLLTLNSASPTNFQTRQAMSCNVNTEVRLRNHWCRGKVVLHAMCVCVDGWVRVRARVALLTQH